MTVIISVLRKPERLTTLSESELLSAIATAKLRILSIIPLLALVFVSASSNLHESCLWFSAGANKTATNLTVTLR